MELLYWIPVALIIGYIVTTCLVFVQVPKSISNTHYMWKEKGFNNLFTFVMWITGITILVYWLSVSSQYKFLPFISIASMCFVGAACAFKETLTDKVHCISAIIWAGAAILYIILMGEYNSLIVGVILSAIGFVANGFKNKTFWLELACVIAMIISIGLIGRIY